MKRFALFIDLSHFDTFQMESTIDTQEGIMTTMKTQIKLLEEQIKTEETQNRLTKEELHHVLEEGNNKDNVIQAKNTIITKLEQDLEDEKRKNEEAEVEMTSLISEKEKIIMRLGDDKAELNNKVKRLEFKCSELNEKLKIVNSELADLKTEYTSYKVNFDSQFQPECPVKTFTNCLIFVLLDILSVSPKNIMLLDILSAVSLVPIQSVV